MKQCKACPWKKGTRPEKDIPGGYCETKHAALKSTIARTGELLLGRAGISMMACHETAPGTERPCVGWMLNQLGTGNNLGLRLRVMSDPGLRAQVGAMRLDGPQCERFEDTLPKKRPSKRRARSTDAEEES